METRVVVLLLLTMSMCTETLGQFGRDLYRRPYSDLLVNIFETLHTMSEPFGLNRRGMYLLATHINQYPPALAASKALKRQIADMKQALENTFMSSFLGTPTTQQSDEDFSFSHMTSSYDDSFTSPPDDDMADLPNSVDYNRSRFTDYYSDSLAVYFEPKQISLPNSYTSILSD